MYHHSPYGHQMWIGLEKTSGTTDTLQWVDGTDFVHMDPEHYQPWASGEPDLNIASCIKTGTTDSTGVWSDEDCSFQFVAVCEKSKELIYKTFLSN